MSKNNCSLSAAESQRSVGKSNANNNELDRLLVQLQNYADKKEQYPRLNPTAVKDLLQLVQKKGEYIRYKGKVILSLFDAKRISNYAEFKASERGRRQALTDDQDIGDNLVVDVGLAQIGRLWLGIDPLFVTYSQVGTSSVGTIPGHTVLLGPITPRVAITEKFQVANVSHADTLYNTTQGNGVLFESGLFNDPTAGTMFARRVLGSSKTKDSTKTMTLQWAVNGIGV